MFAEFLRRQPITHAKVAFEIPGEDGSIEVETLWAQSVGKDLYRLDNSPFYAYEVSWKDEVLAPPAPDGLPTFQKVVNKSGHRTVRIRLDPPYEVGNESAKTMDELVALGCTFEGSRSRLMSVDIPPDVNLLTVRQLLIDRGLEWEHADPLYEQLFPEADA